MNKTVGILLSTYNGEAFLEEQLQSLLHQTYTEYILFVRDDLSTDTTITTIQQYSIILKDRLILLSSTANLGPKLSFSTLIDFAFDFHEIDYFMFMDQDDIWLPNKVELTLEKMNELQRNYPSLPLLVHSDLTVVNSRLQVLSKSLWAYLRLHPSRNRFNHILMQNIVTGCTVMFNRELAALCREIPKEAIMHDWWLALIASAFGKIDIVTQPTLLYRQHSQNNIGAKKTSFWRLFDRRKDGLRNTIIQATVFKWKFLSLLTERQKILLHDLETLENHCFFGKLAKLSRNQLYKHGVFRNIGLLIDCL